MSDGRKAMYEDMEEEHYRQRKQKLSQMKPEELLRIFEKIKQEVGYLYSPSLLLSWSQHSRFQEVRKELEKLP